ncbi:unnamed protein product, partial [Hapterophycus canaliculatus]
MIGFEQCRIDRGVLRFMMGNEVIGMIVIHVEDDRFTWRMIVIHVDDVLFAGLKRLAEYVLQELGNLLPTKNLREFIFFSGCAFRRDREAGTNDISQESYIRSVLERGSKYVAPARSPHPLQTITGPWRRMRRQEMCRSARWWGASCGSLTRPGPT